MIRYEIWPNLLCLITNLRKNGSWCGATHIQKAAFIAQELTGARLGLDFRLYHHGPYSFELKDVLEELEAADAIESAPHPPYGPHLEITDKGFGFWGQFEDDNFDPAPFEFVAKKLRGMNVEDLERIGTAFLVAKEMPEASTGQRAEKLCEYKSHIALAKSEEAFQTVEQWRQEWASNLIPA